MLDGKRLRTEIEFPFPSLPFGLFDRSEEGPWAVGTSAPDDRKELALLIDDRGGCREIDIGEDFQFIQSDPDGSFWTGCSDYGTSFGRGTAKAEF